MNLSVKLILINLIGTNIHYPRASTYDLAPDLEKLSNWKQSFSDITPWKESANIKDAQVANREQVGGVRCFFLFNRITVVVLWSVRTFNNGTRAIG